MQRNILSCVDTLDHGLVQNLLPHPRRRAIPVARLAKPFIKVLLYECVILKMRIGSADAIEFLALTGREFLVRIETPAPFEQALTPQYLMNARNASVKIVRGIEDGAIRIRDLLSQRQQSAGDRIGMLSARGRGEKRQSWSTPPNAPAGRRRFGAAVCRSQTS